MRFKILCSIVIISASVMVATQRRASAQTAQGAISGHIYGPDGKPLGSALVWANIISTPPRPVDRSSILPVLSTSTASDGSFSLSNVPAGDYVLCASNPAVAGLNPCTWGGPPLIKMTAGLQASGQIIHLAAGAALQVHLSDPGGLLAANAAKTGASLIVGLNIPNGFLPLPIAGSTAVSRDYVLLVPFNTNYDLTITTNYFRLNTASGAPIGTGTYTTNVPIPSGTPAQVIGFQVVGTAN